MISALNIKQKSSAFTIVELLIVVIVLVILATLVTVAYRSITSQADETVFKKNLTQASDQLELYKLSNKRYPTGVTTDEALEMASVKRDSKMSYDFTSSGTKYCLSATLNGQTYNIQSYVGSVEEGECPPPPPTYIQTITSSNCPTERTVVADARDNHTYFIQKLADGKCWMLTNLAYAGGTSNSGTNTYNDVIPTGNGTAGTLSRGTQGTANTFIEAKYYVDSNANPTVHPNIPSTNNIGGGTVAGGERQYGYHYNWCAAMGAQSATSACASAKTPAPSTSISVCPAGWRLPTGESTTGEITLLNNAVNGGLTNSDAGLRSTWLAQLGGEWNNGWFTYSGTYGHYWSASQVSSSGARSLYFYSSSVSPAVNFSKGYGRSVRCLAI